MIKRYRVALDDGSREPWMKESELGAYVEYEDYARLKAEVERLERQNEIYNDVTADVITERDSLKAEVERLKNNIAYLDKKLDDELDKGMQS
jgi:hypothetical protein